jgi:hypothetical protein
MEGGQPLISIVTPVGPRHTQHVAVARASLDWQTIPRSWWEHIVIHDTAGDGPAVCRNRGIEQARGTFVVFLDADDYLLPTALETYLRAYAAGNAGYVYGDSYVLNEHGQPLRNESGHPVVVGAYEYRQHTDYDPTTGWRRMGLDTINLHVVTALIPTVAVRAVGGFDEAIDAWEDWTLWLRLARAGHCGQRVPVPTLVYRQAEGDRMRHFVADPIANQARMATVLDRYRDASGRIAMAACCGGNKAAQEVAQAAVLGLPQGETPASGRVRYQYIGEQQGSFTLRSPHTGEVYKLARGRLVDVQAQDMAWIESFGTVRRVVAAPFVPPPDVVVGTAGDMAAVFSGNEMYGNLTAQLPIESQRVLMGQPRSRAK